MDFNIRGEIATCSDSDIIVSTSSETGIANFGFFIIKNTPWSRKFLRDWLEFSALQDGFSLESYYNEKLPDINDHVKKVTFDKSSKQIKQDSILHLMDYPNNLRSKIFSAGLIDVCQAYEDNRPHERQFGLSPEGVLRQSETFYVVKLKQHILILNGTDFDLESYFEIASDCLMDLTELSKLGNNYAATIAAFNGLINDKIKMLVTTVPNDVKSIVALYYLAIPYANLLFDTLPDDAPSKLDVMDRIETYLNTMIPLLAEKSRHFVYNMQIEHYVSKSEYLQSMDECFKAKSAYDVARKIYDSSTDSIDEVCGVNVQSVCCRFL